MDRCDVLKVEKKVDDQTRKLQNVTLQIFKLQCNMVDHYLLFAITFAKLMKASKDPDLTQLGIRLSRWITMFRKEVFEAKQTSRDIFGYGSHSILIRASFIDYDYEAIHVLNNWTSEDYKTMKQADQHYALHLIARGIFSLGWHGKLPVLDDVKQDNDPQYQPHQQPYLKKLQQVKPLRVSSNVPALQFHGKGQQPLHPLSRSPEKPLVPRKDTGSPDSAGQYPADDDYDDEDDDDVMIGNDEEESIVIHEEEKNVVLEDETRVKEYNIQEPNTPVKKEQGQWVPARPATPATLPPQQSSQQQQPSYYQQQNVPPQTINIQHVQSQNISQQIVQSLPPQVAQPSDPRRRREPPPKEPPFYSDAAEASSASSRDISTSPQKSDSQTVYHQHLSPPMHQGMQLHSPTSSPSSSGSARGRRPSFMRHIGRGAHYRFEHVQPPNDDQKVSQNMRGKPGLKQKTSPFITASKYHAKPHRSRKIKTYYPYLRVPEGPAGLQRHKQWVKEYKEQREKMNNHPMPIRNIHDIKQLLINQLGVNLDAPMADPAPGLSEVEEALEAEEAKEGYYTERNPARVQAIPFQQPDNKDFIVNTKPNSNYPQFARIYSTGKRGPMACSIPELEEMEAEREQLNRYVCKLREDIDTAKDEYTKEQYILSYQNLIDEKVARQITLSQHINAINTMMNRPIPTYQELQRIWPFYHVPESWHFHGEFIIKSDVDFTCRRNCVSVIFNHCGQYISRTEEIGDIWRGYRLIQICDPHKNVIGWIVVRYPEQWGQVMAMVGDPQWTLARQTRVCEERRAYFMAQLILRQRKLNALHFEYLVVTLKAFKLFIQRVYARATRDDGYAALRGRTTFKRELYLYLDMENGKADVALISPANNPTHPLWALPRVLLRVDHNEVTVHSAEIRDYLRKIRARAIGYKPNDGDDIKMAAPDDEEEEEEDFIECIICQGNIEKEPNDEIFDEAREEQEARGDDQHETPYFYTTLCNHPMHYICFDQWKAIAGRQCPKCRQPVINGFVGNQAPYIPHNLSYNEIKTLWSKAYTSPELPSKRYKRNIAREAARLTGYTYTLISNIAAARNLEESDKRRIMQQFSGMLPNDLAAMAQLNAYGYLAENEICAKRMIMISRDVHETARYGTTIVVTYDYIPQRYVPHPGVEYGSYY